MLRTLFSDIGKRWLDATVEDVSVDFACVQVRLNTGKRESVRMEATSPDLRKWGVDHAPQKPKKRKPRSYDSRPWQLRLGKERKR